MCVCVGGGRGAGAGRRARRGLAMHLGAPVRVARTWRPFAEEVLAEDARRRTAAAAAPR